MKRIVTLAAGALAAAVSLPAAAADFGVASSGSTSPSIYVTPPSVPERGAWSGFYLGGLASYTRANFADGITAEASGLGFGGYAGVNVQNNAILIGVEAGGTWSPRVNDGAGNAIEWTGEVRGRFGFAMNRVLVYGAGGMVIANVTTSTPSESLERGWTVGGGAEMAIGRALTVRAEYVYQRFGEIAAATPTTLTTQGIRTGIGLRF